ncbi:MAG: hypothetical protein H0V82_00025 [Candidatus Protochlamydia sp.]|nr:hypothetical protein [Candidatus Protochlamydia sp.]
MAQPFNYPIDPPVFRDLHLFYLLASKKFLDHRSPSHLFNDYYCQYTDHATVNNVFNDKNIEKAINISQKQINVLLSANFEKVRNLSI